MKRSLGFLFVVAGAVLGLDLATKRLAVEHLAGRPPVEILGPLVRLTYTLNSGVAFGLGAGRRFPYYLFSIAAVVVILALVLRQRVHAGPRRLALALIMGGALGNLVDRLRSGLVVDFIEIGWGRWHWPVFNVADSAVTIGVVMFALAWTAHGHDAAPQAADAGPESALAARTVVPAEMPLDESDTRAFGSGRERG